MAETVYVLCAITSLLCALMLARSYGKNRTQILLWSSLCFVAAALNNIILVVDLIVLPDSIDLTVLRSSTMLLGTMLLLYGLIWEKA